MHVYLHVDRVGGREREANFGVWQQTLETRGVSFWSAMRHLAATQNFHPSFAPTISFSPNTDAPTFAFLPLPLLFSLSIYLDQYMQKRG